MVSIETQKTKREDQVVTLILAYFPYIFQLSALPQKNYKKKIMDGSVPTSFLFLDTKWKYAHVHEACNKPKAN